MSRNSVDTDKSSKNSDDLESDDKYSKQQAQRRNERVINGFEESSMSTIPNHQNSNGTAGRVVSGIDGKSSSSHKLDAGNSTPKKSGTRKKRSRSVYGVIPHGQFGPKANLDNVSHLTIPDPSSQKLTWNEPLQSVLVVRKHLDSNVLIPFSKMVAWLVENMNEHTSMLESVNNGNRHNMYIVSIPSQVFQNLDKTLTVYVEHSVMTDPNLVANEEFNSVRDRLHPFVEGKEDLTNKIDFIICLGGDGTLLYASSLFQVDVPPVMAFNMGSLGFLTPFQFDHNFKKNVSKVMEGSPSVLLHYRLKCVLMSGDSSKLPHVKNISKNNSNIKAHKLVLNEVVVDRGPSSYLSNFELFIEGRRVTSVQGDGLIISTPTGSTAYAVAAGASMVHPSVPCILITPICPHSLSFRPIVVPAGVEIKVLLSPSARNTSMVSFDGRDRLEMLHGDVLLITTALYPVPSICAVDQMEDWFESLAVCLNWNVRRPQNALESSASQSSLLSSDDLDASSVNND